MWEWVQSFSQFVNDLLAGVFIKTVMALSFIGILHLFDMTHPSIKALVVLMLLDFALGAAHALKESRFTLAGIRRGIAKFIVYAIALTVTSMADAGVQLQQYAGLTMTEALCAYLVVCEALSALRHLAEFGGPQLPPWLFARLESIKRSIETPDKDAGWRGHKPDGGNNE